MNAADGVKLLTIGSAVSAAALPSRLVGMHPQANSLCAKNPVLRRDQLPAAATSTKTKRIPISMTSGAFRPARVSLASQNGQDAAAAVDVVVDAAIARAKPAGRTGMLMIAAVKTRT
jgi:hypothetical protein